MRKISNADYDSLLRYVPMIVDALDKDMVRLDCRIGNAVRLTNRIIKKMKRNDGRNNTD